jgi:hypothetical protein
MENKKPMKIGLIFLGFFCNFLHIFKDLLKKKKERIKQSWAGSGPNGPGPGQNAPARARVLASLQKRPQVFD